MGASSRTLPILLMKVRGLDLDLITKIAGIRFKGTWPSEHEYEIARQYRKFLELLALTAERTTIIPPTEDIHRFWKVHHEHMGMYYTDIIHVTGRFIPCPMIAFRRNKRVQETKDLWQSHFGEASPADPPREKWLSVGRIFRRARTSRENNRSNDRNTETAQ